MAEYTEEKILDQITVDPISGTVLWRYSVNVYKDGVLWKTDYERSSAPLDDPDPSRIPAGVLPYRAMVDTPQARQKLKEIKDKAPKPEKVK